METSTITIVLEYCYIKGSAIVSVVLGELWLAVLHYTICPEQRRAKSYALKSDVLRQASTEALLVMLHQFT